MCTKSYSTPNGLQRHKYIHKLEDLKLKCLGCDKTFPFQSQLKIHKLKHSSYGKYECDECFQTYK